MSIKQFLTVEIMIQMQNILTAVRLHTSWDNQISQQHKRLDNDTHVDKLTTQTFLCSRSTRKTKAIL